MVVGRTEVFDQQFPQMTAFGGVLRDVVPATTEPERGVAFHGAAGPRAPGRDERWRGGGVLLSPGLVLAKLRCPMTGTHGRGGQTKV